MHFQWCHDMETELRAKRAVAITGSEWDEVVSKEARQWNESPAGTIIGQSSTTDGTPPLRWKMWLLVTQLMHSMCGEGRFGAMQFRYLLNLVEETCLDYTTTFLRRQLPLAHFKHG